MQPLILRCACVLFVAGLGFAGARPVSATSLFTNYTGETTVSMTDRTIGTEFTVGALDIMLTSLGVYDSAGDGLTAAHNVGIWRIPSPTVAELIGSVEIPMGTSASLVESWRFVDVPTLKLDANTVYRIAAHVGSVADDSPRDGSFSFDPALSSVTAGSFTHEDTTLNPPFTVSSSTRLFANAQFSIVPEPSTALLMGLGLAALAVRRRA